MLHYIIYFIYKYPSIKWLNANDAPNSFNNATTATGSVADNTDPNVNA